jgi:predicted outer membrane repeat protein
VRCGLNVSDSIVTGNSTTGSAAKGGGLYVRGYDHNYNRLLTVTNSTVSGNRATGAGGGMYANFNTSISDSNIVDNMSGHRGGGFALYYYKNFGAVGTRRAIITNSTITDNNAVHSGGGFSAAGVDATNTTITDNSTPGHGGGFAAPPQKDSGPSSIRSGDVKLVDCVVTGNTAGTKGGGFYAGVFSTLTNTIVSQNMGGGFYSARGATLNSSTVSNNTTSGRGGGILAPGTYFTFGTRYYQGGPVILNSSTVTGNTSGGSGGGIYARDSVELNDSTVSDNEATGGWRWDFRTHHHSI